MKNKLSDMKFLILQQQPFVTPGGISKWLQSHSHEYFITHLYQDMDLPALDSFDVLLVLGGTMNVYEEQKYPWLVSEKMFIEKAVKKEKCVLGICLGAQILADVLGARVRQNEHLEIGWHTLALEPDVKEQKHWQDFPNEFETFLWHQDTFDLPENSIRFAKSMGCENQGFIFDQRVVGLQFHPEETLEGYLGLLKRYPFVENPPFVQSPKSISENRKKFETNYTLLSKILDNITNIAINRQVK